MHLAVKRRQSSSIFATISGEEAVIKLLGPDLKRTFYESLPVLNLVDQPGFAIGLSLP